MKKRLFRTLLCLAVIFACLPQAVSAAGGEYDFERDPYYQRFKGQNITLNVYNWGEYISDGSDGALDVLEEFEELTGITVRYTMFASNEEMYAKIKSGGVSYDVIIPSDYMVARMAAEGMLLKLDYDNIPNAALIGDSYTGLEYDPGDEYSVPYMWGIVGIIYNSTMIEDEITSWDALWDERFMGNILMFSNSRDAFGISLARLGYSMNTENPDEIRQAADELKAQKMLVQAYVMDEIFNKMEGGEAAIAPYYAGDAITMISENPDLRFVVPDETTNYFVDAMVIPAGAANKEAAEMFINFMCEPEISAANAEYIGYSTPVTDALELLELDAAAYEIAYPDEETLENTEVFKLLPDEINALMDSLWTEALSFNENENRWIMPVFLVVCLTASLVITVVRSRRKKKNVY